MSKLQVKKFTLNRTETNQNFQCALHVIISIQNWTKIDHVTSWKHLLRTKTFLPSTNYVNAKVVWVLTMGHWHSSTRQNTPSFAQNEKNLGPQSGYLCLATYIKFQENMPVSFTPFFQVSMHIVVSLSKKNCYLIASGY